MKTSRTRISPGRRALFGFPNVVGTGTGYKRVQGVDTGQMAVVVFVSEKLPARAMSRSAIVPPEVDGLPTDVIEIGRLKALRPDSAQAARVGRLRPAPGGVSIGHPDITAGTLGAVVWERSAGRPMILSNNHVLANSSTHFPGKPPGEVPVLQPGPYDGGTKDDAIALLYRFVPLKRHGVNFFDAALAVPYLPRDVSPEILGLGEVRGICEPDLRLNVQKSGRTTGITSGTITALDAFMQVDYEEWVLFFAGLTLAVLRSEGGDSGSLVVDGDMNAVGLLFAGSDEITAMMPVHPLAEALNFSVTPLEGASHERR